MNRQKSHSILLLIAGSFIIAWLLFFILPGPMEIFKLQANDQLFRLRYKFIGKRSVSPYIIHVDIDDSSIREHSELLQNNLLYTKIIDILTYADVKGIAFDILFPECNEPGNCSTFVQAAHNSGKLYFPIVLKLWEEENSQDISQNIIDLNDPKPNTLWHIVVTNLGHSSNAEVAFIPFKELKQAAKGIGHITCYPDRDGVFRKFPLLIHYGHGFIPSLSFRMLCDYLQVAQERIEVAFGKHIKLYNAQFPDGRQKDITIPIDEKGNIIINFAGPWKDSFSHYSVSKLLEIGKNDDLLELLRDDIEGVMVIVSDVSTKSRDIGPVPLENFYPLSGLHVNIINSFLKQDFLDELSPGVEVLINFILIIILFLIAIKLSGLWFAIAASVVLAIYIGFSGWLFLFQNIFSNIVRPSLGILFSLGSITVYKYISEEKQRAYLRARFEDYFAPTLLDKILSSPKTLEACEEKVLTILFSDISGFTSWSSTKQPDEIRSTLNEYFKEMAKIVFKYEGTIDKYIGDGLMAFFGDPTQHKDHALRAVKAAIEMQQKTRELKQEWEAQERMPIKIRIGINTGKIVVGNMGSEKRLDYTVIGANVNLAQRLESNAPVEGILVSRAVYEKIKDFIEAKPVKKIRCKGFEKEVEVFEVEV